MGLFINLFIINAHICSLVMNKLVVSIVVISVEASDYINRSIWIVFMEVWFIVEGYFRIKK